MRRMWKRFCAALIGDFPFEPEANLGRLDLIDMFGQHEHAAAVLAAVIDHATTDRERRALNEGVTP